MTLGTWKVHIGKTVVECKDDNEADIMAEFARSAETGEKVLVEKPAWVAEAEAADADAAYAAFESLFEEEDVK